MSHHSSKRIRRTYNRPLNEEATAFETWEQTVGRTIDHQRWLWQRAKGEPLDMLERQELIDLAELLKDRKKFSGRTNARWNRESKKREATQFNCSGRSDSTRYSRLIFIIITDVEWI